MTPTTPDPLPPELLAELRRRNLSVQPKGGRPPKTSRDIAVFLANHWRRHHLSETSEKAAEWIISEWKDDGIREAAHVRTRLREARKRLPKKMVLIALPDGFVAALIAHPSGTTVAAGAGWAWWPEMTEAVQVRADPPPAPMESAISSAIRGATT